MERFRRLPAALALTVALAGAGAAATTAADHGAGARFHVTATFLANQPVFDPPCLLHVISNGTATGTQIGLGQFLQDECLDPVSQAPKVHVVGEATFIAANGDRLIAAYDATTDLPTPEVHPRGTFDIVGGTGRFAGATGSGSLTVDGIAGGPETAVFDGTIRL
jgi:hypothetical protein